MLRSSPDSHSRPLTPRIYYIYPGLSLDAVLQHQRLLYSTWLLQRRKSCRASPLESGTSRYGRLP